MPQFQNEFEKPLKGLKMSTNPDKVKWFPEL